MGGDHGGGADEGGGMSMLRPRSFAERYAQHFLVERREPVVRLPAPTAPLAATSPPTAPVLLVPLSVLSSCSCYLTPRLIPPPPPFGLIGHAASFTPY
jgi:hypothetical protein